MTFDEQKELVADLRMLADFYERPESIELPVLYLSEYSNVSTWEYSEEDKKYAVNIDKSKAKMRRVVKALGGCEKHYDNGNLRVVKRLNERVKLEYTIDRSAYCERVPTGETRVIPATPERVEEQYEWVCNDMSLLK